MRSSRARSWTARTSRSRAWPSLSSTTPATATCASCSKAHRRRAVTTENSASSTRREKECLSYSGPARSRSQASRSKQGRRSTSAQFAWTADQHRRDTLATMSSDRFRVLALAGGSLALIVLSTLVMDWFVASIDGVLDIARITFDLREARACSPLGPCAVVPMSMVQGSYPTAATVAFWSSLGFALVVLYQAGSRVLSGYANETLSKVAHVIGSIAILTAVGAGYLF